MKRSHLPRRTPLARGSKRLKSVGRSRRSIIPEAVKAAVRARSRSVCERKVRGIERCYFAATDFHHVLPRSQGGKHTVENLRHLCRLDHDFCKLHPVAAEAEGLIRRWNIVTDGGGAVARSIP